MTQPVKPVTKVDFMPGGDTSIGGLLLKQGKLTPENAEAVLRMQNELGIRFGEAAQRLGFVTENDIQQALARQFDYPYLQVGEGSYSSQLIAAYQPFSPQVETLRAVRSQLMLRWCARGHKSIAIVGIDAGDGASLFAANLAIVFSQLGERTLLVDADMRAPQQQDIFALKARQGLSDMLAARTEHDPIERIDDFVALSVLTAGTLPPNPQELLARSAFVALNGRLEQQYDLVIYDTPAFNTSADALAVVARTRGVLLVVRKNKTALADINAMTEHVRNCGAEVVGSVLID